MPAKYKDYPIYTYDEPVTYSDFSGGINTDPSNEHLNENEMRDCLNMHYRSAALVKRKGASLLCTISCEDELFNIQGVFLFTYKISYLIIAADGKLYQGVYTPNATITLTRLRISSDTAASYQLYNPVDLTVGLETYYEELKNIQHEGFIHQYLLSSKTGETLSSEEYSMLGDYISLHNDITFKPNDVVEYKHSLWILRRLATAPSDAQLTKTLIAPGTFLCRYWLTLDEYNAKYKEAIVKNSDYLSNQVQEIQYLIKENNIWKVNPETTLTNTWYLNTDKYIKGTILLHRGTLYICDEDHYSLPNAPRTGGERVDTYHYWERCTYKQDLIFQNYLPIEAATYNNKLYIATGTRFIQVYLLSNELQASIVEPYYCNSSEITNIGYNYLSPYPELCSKTRYDQAITSITGLIPLKQITGEYILTPQMNFANSESESDYYFKWEKKVGDDWVTLIRYKDNQTGDQTKLDRFTLTVDDADKHQYRVSFAKSFNKPEGIVNAWDYNTSLYKVGDRVSVKESDGSKEKIYECIKEHCPKELIWDSVNYEKEYYKDESISNEYYVGTYKQSLTGEYYPEATPIFSVQTTTKHGKSLYEDSNGIYVFKRFLLDSVNNKIQQGTIYWREIFTEQEVLSYNTTTKEFVTTTDWEVDEVDGEYFGQATSVLATELKPEQTFEIIQSCRKIISDGNKFLLYGDKYNSGSWYKTIINNPAYITQRGGLSFKTTKNEELIKVVAFNGSIIAFANSENIGGSIHLITGNGDDYDDQSGYYSPYRRVTINSNISCDNANTVQICENLLVFKYFDTVYYISSSELTNEVVSVYSCNDRIKHENNFVKIPWDDNSCISEVTEDYYALIWKEKYYIENDDIIQERPAIKLKMYYKLGYQLNEKIVFPWLKDESTYFNIDYITYIKGKPIYLYNNSLISFNENVYTDFGKPYKCMIHFRGEDIGYPKLYKLISNVLVYYHHNQYSKIDFNLFVRNEAGHSLLDSTDKVFSLQDLRVLRAGDKLVDGAIRLDSTILDSKVFNTQYKFPCLLVDTIIESENDKEFSLSSITYNYTTCESPDRTPYDLYSNIIRPKEVK